MIAERRRFCQPREYEPPSVKAAREGEICRNNVAQLSIKRMSDIYRNTAVTVVADLGQRGKSRSAATNRLHVSKAYMMSYR